MERSSPEIESRQKPPERVVGQSLIVFVLPSLAGGGAERVLLNLARQFSSREVQLELWILGNGPDQYSPGADWHVVRRFNSRSAAGGVLSLWWALLVRRPRMVFSTLLRTHVALYLAVRLTLSKPGLVLRSPNVPVAYDRAGFGRWPMSMLLDRAYRSSALVIAQTVQMRLALLRKHRLLPERCIVLSNPVDVSQVRGLAECGPSPVWPVCELRVLFLGRLVDQKNVPYLLRSFYELQMRLPGAVLVLVGADVLGLRASLERLAAELGIQDSVDFRDFDGNPFPLLRSADVLVLSSQYEGFPNVVLESIALHTPVVVTPCCDALLPLLTGEQNGLVSVFDDPRRFAGDILRAAAIRTFALPPEENLPEVSRHIWSAGGLTR